MYIAEKKLICCDICKDDIADNIDQEEADCEQDEDGFHFCKKHSAVASTFTLEEKIYATENSTTNLAGFAAWKMLQ
jgi:hypothetical protein